MYFLIKCLIERQIMLYPSPLKRCGCWLRSFSPSYIVHLCLGLHSLAAGAHLQLLWVHFVILFFAIKIKHYLSVYIAHLLSSFVNELYPSSLKIFGIWPRFQNPSQSASSLWGFSSWHPFASLNPVGIQKINQ